MIPKLSIIIPCYNCEDTLKEAFDSAYKQGLKESDFEVVMVDDGSTDGTHALMSELAHGHHNVRIKFHEKNMGGGATRNTAARHSKGSAIFCLDSDDILPPGTLWKMLDYMEDKRCDGVGISTSIKFKGTDTSHTVAIHHFGYVGERVPFESLLQADNVYCPLYSTFLISQAAFKAIDGYPEHHGFDTQGIAWRFLAAGLTAYTCPDTSYLHRVEHTDSYYVREAHAGRVNYNWQDILLEHIELFDADTQKFIQEYDCKDFTKNLLEDLKKRDKIFAPEYASMLHPRSYYPKITARKHILIKRNSPRGIYLRLKSRLKRYPRFYRTVFFFYLFILRLLAILGERAKRASYYRQIDAIRKEKRIVVHITFGGIGDWLVYSTLPKLLKEQYDIDFYISKSSLDNLRNRDIFDLCYVGNPYFKGTSDASNTFTLQTFVIENPLWTILTDRGGENLVETLERQFGLKGNGRPVLAYVPKRIPELEHTVLVDTNMISGKRFGWTFKDHIFEDVAESLCTNEDTVINVDPKAQDLKTYVDMIHSSKYFVCTFSGGASLAAAIDHPRIVIFPTNARNRSNYQFAYSGTNVRYV